MAPTRTLAQLASLVIRQDNPPQATVTVVQPAPQDNDNDNDNGGGGNDGLSAGAIVGIVIGVIVGLILLWWIFKSMSRDKNSRMAPAPDRQAYDPEMDAVIHSSRSRSRPVVYDDKMYVATPVQPAAVYTSRSRSRSRY
ncbi:hypothetical protein B0T20DRAFT_484799 [Sordaria brevicollis]|uniref:Uncharacterized protein n=1 Tax=Sordaria brevicollis TaxID=83679 RepID=A0AAE0NRJ4_SORBR|nr:hypothetical protein B0T20DRAFT_484799 [Sordaria brevicollis]